MKHAKTVDSPSNNEDIRKAMEIRRKAWQAAADISSAAARADLLAKGIGYVYEREGVVYRRMADGSEQVITNPKTQ